MKSIIIANITWNASGWRDNTYINPHAGHRYARKYPGHESLNFKFDKKIDKNGKVYGYVQWTHHPKKFSNGGVIIFYSRNLKTNEGEIVGIYGNVEILASPKKTPYPGFHENELYSNIIAEENLSMLFPVPLSDKKYKKMLATKRLVPQVGFRLVDDLKLAKSIIHDEITALKQPSIRQAELKKLKAIYEYITGESYILDLRYEDEDLREQDEILKILRRRKEDYKEKIIQDLKGLKPADPEIIKIEGKTYKRDNKTIAELKILRDFKCQICNTQILKRDGSFYVEAAHIIPKHRKGLEVPENILILCPNHHKEFDLGNKKIISHTKDKIIFILNNKKFTVNLGFE